MDRLSVCYGLPTKCCQSPALRTSGRWSIHP